MIDLKMVDVFIASCQFSSFSLHHFCTNFAFLGFIQMINHNGAAVLDIDFFYFDTETQYWYIQMWLHFMEKRGPFEHANFNKKVQKTRPLNLLIFNFHLSIQVFP